jgi:hypothetical protein
LKIPLANDGCGIDGCDKFSFGVICISENGYTQGVGIGGDGGKRESGYEEVSASSAFVEVGCIDAGGA